MCSSDLRRVPVEEEGGEGSGRQGSSQEQVCRTASASNTPEEKTERGTAQGLCVLMSHSQTHSTLPRSYSSGVCVVCVLSVYVCVCVSSAAAKEQQWPSGGQRSDQGSWLEVLGKVQSLLVILHSWRNVATVTTDMLWARVSVSFQKMSPLNLLSV